jgi:hypothetical protein
MVAYAIGLVSFAFHLIHHMEYLGLSSHEQNLMTVVTVQAMANAAVYIMQMGQPALLYLVPCCLGTMMYIGHKSRELKELWEGPRVIRAADNLLYGGPRVETGNDERTPENEVHLENETEAELT